MKTLQVIHREINYKDYIKRSAKSSDFSKLITDPTLLKENDEIIGVYGVLKDPPEELLRAILNTHIGKNKRTAGLRTQSRIFGYMPREVIRKDYCSSTSLAFEQPEEHATICNFATKLVEYYKAYCPEVYTKHLAIVNGKVLKDWTIESTPFTSGIINKNNPLKYHFDKGNFANVYSNMVCLRKDTEGGYLSIPEYDIGIEIANNSILFFDGQKILHGVTPITYSTPKAYRFTLVYYSLKQMWNCEPINTEIARIRNRKTEREVSRFKRLTGTLMNDPLKEKYVAKN